MKKLFPLLLLLLSFSAIAQEEYRFDQKFKEADQAFSEVVRIAARKARDETNAMPHVIAFEKQLQEDLNEIQRKVLDPLNPSGYVEVSVNASVVEIFNGSALVVSREFAKHFKVNTSALQRGWEYYFRLKVNISEKEKIHCTGCTGVLEAVIVGYSISPEQAKRNILAISQPEEGLGYDRSPRHH
jgi:hypothetical protein